jgi:hypothetical protein
MRNAALILAALVMAAGCSSSTQNAKIIEPEVELLQIVGPAELNYPTGNVDVQFEFRIFNKSSEPITLKHLDLASVGGGAYSLRRELRPFNVVVGPNEGKAVTVWSKAYLRGRTAVENEPVSIRGIAYFNSPSGPFRKIFHQEFGQYPGANGPD